MISFPAEVQKRDTRTGRVASEDTKGKFTMNEVSSWPLPPPHLPPPSSPSRQVNPTQRDCKRTEGRSDAAMFVYIQQVPGGWEPIITFLLQLPLGTSFSLHTLLDVSDEEKNIKPDFSRIKNFYLSAANLVFRERRVGVRRAKFRSTSSR